MSRTRRIYNKKIKKCQRYNIDIGIHIDPTGIPYTKRSWICMGKCPMCRDYKLEPKLIRKKNKEELRMEIKNV